MTDLEEYIKIGEGKTKKKLWQVFVLAIFAGMFIALAGYFATVVSYTIEIKSVAKLLSGLVFPIGLILVILLNTELFTGNNLLVMPLFDKKISFNDMIINWGIVYLGNFIGALLVAVLVYFSGIKGNDLLVNAFVNITNTKISFTFIQALILGFFCNFLVCIAVFLGVTEKDKVAKLIMIFLPVFMFVALGFEHSIANMYYLSQGFLLSNIGAGEILLNNILPVTIGNILGGVAVGCYLYFVRNKK